MNKVCVLMATYNPVEYVVEQIESILSQKNVELELIIRDDASKTENKEILRKYSCNPKVTLIEGDKNLGVTGNIKKLLEYAYEFKSEYNYFAYSDQDDVWYPDKLEVAIKELNKLENSLPCLYCSNLLVTDYKLTPTHELFRKNVVKGSFAQSLAQVFILACTSVINFKMVEKLIKYDFEPLGYDTFVYYLAALSKQLYFDNQPHILYRQHGDNVSGQKYNGLKYIIHHSISAVSSKEIGTMKNNAKFLLDNLSSELSQEQLKLLNTVYSYDQSWKNKIKLILNKKIKAGYFPKDFYNFMKILIGKY